jgi:hypothetical protein
MDGKKRTVNLVHRSDQICIYYSVRGTTKRADASPACVFAAVRIGIDQGGTKQDSQHP